MTYMDCWHMIAPILLDMRLVNCDEGLEAYVMIFTALKEAQERKAKGLSKHGED